MTSKTGRITPHANDRVREDHVFCCLLDLFSGGHQALCEVSGVVKLFVNPKDPPLINYGTDKTIAFKAKYGVTRDMIREIRLLLKEHKTATEIADLLGYKIDSLRRFARRNAIDLSCRGPEAGCSHAITEKQAVSRLLKMRGLDAKGR